MKKKTKTALAVKPLNQHWLLFYDKADSPEQLYLFISNGDFFFYKLGQADQNWFLVSCTFLFICLFILFFFKSYKVFCTLDQLGRGYLYLFF